MSRIGHRVTEQLIRWVRSDPTYQVSPGLSTADIAVEVMARGAAFARAQVFLLGVKGSRIRFVEPRCSIRHRRHLTIGRGSVIEAGARLRCLSRDGIVIGDDVTIGKFALIECTSVLWNMGVGLSIGNRSSVGDFCFVGCAGGVKIGAGVLMGQHVSFHSQNHNFEDDSRPIRDQGVESRGIVVGDDCWIGAGAKILDGVTLGDGCIVASGAVVTRSFPSGSIVAGVPARVQRSRTDVPPPVEATN